MPTTFDVLKQEFGDLRRDALRIKWMLALTLLLELATLVKLYLH
jgi:hypothetical protein